MRCLKRKTGKGRRKGKEAKVKKWKGVRDGGGSGGVVAMVVMEKKGKETKVEKWKGVRDGGGSGGGSGGSGSGDGGDGKKR